MQNNKLTFDGNAYRIELTSGIVYEGSTTNLIAHFAVDTITICDRATKLHIPIMSSRANILEINGSVVSFEQAQTTIEDALSSAGGASSADKVSYDNTNSGLQSTTVQDAIDEVGANLGELSPKVNSLMSRADVIVNSAENVAYGTSNVNAELDKQYAQKITNLFNPATITEGYYVNYSSGNISVKSDRITSDYIPVKEGQYVAYVGISDNYAGSNVSSFCWYDDQKVKKVSGAQRWDNGLTDTRLRVVPNGCSYIRVSCSNSQVSNAKFFISDSEFEIPTEQIPYGGYVGGEFKIDELKAEVDRVNSQFDNLNNAVYTPKIYQLFDKSSVTLDKLVNYIYGTLINIVDAFTSDYIPVKEGQYIMEIGGVQQYEGTNSSPFCWYDAQKSRVENVEGQQSTEQGALIVVPQGIHYVRVSNKPTSLYLDTFMLLVSDFPFIAPSEYIQYGNYIGGDPKVEKIEGATFAIRKNALYGKSFVSLGDSLSNGRVWEKKLADMSHSEFLATFQQGGTMSIPSGYSNKSTQDRVLELCASNLMPDYIFIEDVNDRWLSSDWTTGAKEPIGSISDFPFMLSQYIDIDYGYTTKEQAEAGFVANFGNIVSSVSNKIKGSIIRVKYGENCICRYFVGTTSDEFINQAKWSESITLYSCYKGIIETLQKTYKNSRLVWWLPTFWTCYKYEDTPSDQLFSDGSCDIISTIKSSDQNYYFLMAKQLRVIVEEVCELYSIQFVNCHKIAGITPFNSDEYGNSGDIHYFAKTHERMADILYKSVM